MTGLSFGLSSPDTSRSQTLLTIRQNSRLVLLRYRYTVLDADSIPIATFSKNLLYDLFRKRWECTDPRSAVLCMAFEDSILKSILRRFCGPLLGLLRTNFIITAPGGPDARTLGSFDRRWTIRDRYVLDMTADTPPSVDRRIALALGVMLDTGENR